MGGVDRPAAGAGRAGAAMSAFDRFRALLGREAVLDAGSERGRPPRVAPDSVDAVALVLGTAYEEGWRVRVEGAGTWMPGDAPADLVLTTRRLDRVTAVAPEDLTATAEAGAPLDTLRERLAERGAWIALDAPGQAARTLGSVIATATAGPLRQGFGPVRDHLLGLSVVTGDGRVVTSGGRVMKNVAGYDLTKLHTGGFGAFGVVVAAHLRLRALPRTDVTCWTTCARPRCSLPRWSSSRQRWRIARPGCSPSGSRARRSSWPPTKRRSAPRRAPASRRSPPTPPRPSGAASPWASPRRR
jgi:hypothetical protein